MRQMKHLGLLAILPLLLAACTPEPLVRPEPPRPPSGDEITSRVESGYPEPAPSADEPLRLTSQPHDLEAWLTGPHEPGMRALLESIESSQSRGDFQAEQALALLIDWPADLLDQLHAAYAHRTALVPWLDLARTSRRFLLDDAQLLPALKSWQQRHPTAGYPAEEAMLWLLAWRQIQPLPTRVAVILPGPDSPLARPGRALRDGLLSAWIRLPVPRRPELLFFPVGDAPEAAVEAWFSAREQRADFVNGPLVREQVDALLRLGDSSLPMLLLNHPSDPRQLTRFPGLVSALALNPEEEAELAAVRALIDGHRRVLILRQDSDWGDRVATAFAQTFVIGGGRVMRDMRYPAGQVDHTLLLEVLLGLDRSRERATTLRQVLGMPIESEPAARTDADLIFLAARAEDGRAIRPQLKFFGAGDLPVFATAQIVSGAPNPRRDHDLEGVLIPLSPWFHERGAAAQQRLRAERLYEGLDNPTLSRLFALGSDAMELLPWLSAMRADPSLELPALTGRLHMDPGRKIERDLPFVRLVAGRPIPE